MKFIEDYADNYLVDGNLYGHSVRELFNTTSIYIVPMVNPDGVNLVTGAYSLTSQVYRNSKYISSFYPNIPFPSGWKANIRGVDLKKLQPVCAYLSF